MNGREDVELDFIVLKEGQLRLPMEINFLKVFHWIIKTCLKRSKEYLTVMLKSFFCLNNPIFSLAQNRC